MQNKMVYMIVSFNDRGLIYFRMCKNEDMLLMFQILMNVLVLILSVDQRRCVLIREAMWIVLIYYVLKIILGIYLLSKLNIFFRVIKWSMKFCND